MAILVNEKENLSCEVSVGFFQYKMQANAKLQGMIDGYNQAPQKDDYYKSRGLGYLYAKGYEQGAAELATSRATKHLRKQN